MTILGRRMRASGRVGRSTAPTERTVRGRGFCHGQAGDPQKQRGCTAVVDAGGRTRRVDARVNSGGES